MRDSACGYDCASICNHSACVCTYTPKRRTHIHIHHADYSRVYGVIDITEIPIGLKSIVRDVAERPAREIRAGPYSVCHTIWSLTHIRARVCVCGYVSTSGRKRSHPVRQVFAAPRCSCVSTNTHRRRYCRRRRRRRRIIYTSIHDRKDICQY